MQKKLTTDEDRQSDTKISLGNWTVVHVELVFTLCLLNMPVVMCT